MFKSKNTRQIGRTERRLAYGYEDHGNFTENQRFAGNIGAFRTGDGGLSAGLAGRVPCDGKR